MCSSPQRPYDKPMPSTRPYRGKYRDTKPWRAYSTSEMWKIMLLYDPSLYRLLFLERKWAAPHDGPIFPFLQLPAELRMGVYRHVLVHPAPIELWPHARNNTMYGSTSHRRSKFDEYRDLTRNLGLLRVCSLIHSEASPIFYGENEFRFSGINAWMVLDAFMYTITPRNFQYLQHLTVHVPFPGTESLANPTFASLTFTERTCISVHQRSHLAGFLRRFGLRVPEYWNYDAAVSRTVKNLAVSYNLRVFQLVLPPTYYIRHNSNTPTGSLGWYWRKLELLVNTVNANREAQNLVPLHVGFIFLKLIDSYHRVSVIARELRPWLVRYRGQTKRMRDKLRETEWIDSVSYGIHDWVGYYDVLDWKECHRLAGPLTMKLEEIEEEDIENWAGYTGL